MVLGIRFDNLNLEQTLLKIKEFLSGGSRHYVVLPYSSFLIESRKDEEFRQILNRADLCLADGIGPVIASRFGSEEKLRGRVTGVELIRALFEKFGTERSFFLFGAKAGVAQEAADRLLLKYPDGKIAGTLNGYVNDQEAIDAINNVKPEILLVALGMPKQEKWIANNLKKLPSVRLAVGVGGAFDFISGRVKRAPKFIQKMGLEWAWRMFAQPKKFFYNLKTVVIFLKLIFT